jgi:hypothetical protein
MPDKTDDGSSGAAQSLSSAQQKTLSQGDASGVTSCPTKKHWIEIKLEDENGDPIPNESYVITGPANEKHSGSLDANGFVRIDGLDPGQCDVSFPRLYKRYSPSIVEGNMSRQS